MPLLTIGKVAQKAHVGAQTIRFYERMGLLPPPQRSPSGYRMYEPPILRYLSFIQKARSLGFSLEEIRDLLMLRVESRSAEVCRCVLEKVKVNLKRVREKRQSLERIEKILEDLLYRCENRQATEACPILQALEENQHHHERR